MALLMILAAPLSLWWFVRLEERDRSEVGVLVVLGVVLVESIIYPSQNSVPGGLLHPSIGGQGLRLPEVILPIALLARVLVHGAPQRLSGTAMAWAAFLTWYAIGLPLGIVMGTPFNEATFHFKTVVYFGGGFALVAGIPATRLAHTMMHRSLLLWVGLVVGVCTPFALAYRSFDLPIPLLPGAAIGRFGADGATVFAMIAIIGLLLEAARRKRSIVMGLAATPLLLSSLVAEQRAAVIGAVASLVVVLVASFGPTWSRRIRTTPTELLLVICIVAAPVLVTVGLRSALSTTPTAREAIPLQELVDDTFRATRKAQSAETRQEMWDEGFAQGAEYPLTGWGLGKTYNIEIPSQPGRFLAGSAFHNVLIDLLVRRGLVGVVLFLVAVALTLRDSLSVWRTHLDRRIAVFTGACGAALVGLLTKAMVESLFEKFRLATLFGLILGAIASGISSIGDPVEAPEQGAQQPA